MNRIIVAFFICFLWCEAIAQSGGLDLSFHTGSGAENQVETITIQSDGKVIVGGVFTQFNGALAQRVTRLNADGTTDSVFNVNTGEAAGSCVYATALQNDGKILLGGIFTSFNGVICKGLARLNPSGTLDSAFNMQVGFNGNVYAVAVQNDGKIIVGGLFSAFNHVSCNNLARLNPDGSLDTSFMMGTGPNAAIQAIAIQPDGKIIIGGDFLQYNGNFSMRIARVNVNGTLDTGFNPVVGADKVIYTIALQPDGEIIIGGSFTSYQQQPHSCIARLDPNGNLDALFNPATAVNQGGEVSVVRLMPNGEVFVGGKIVTYNGKTMHNLVLLDSRGGIDTTFNPQAGADSYVYAADVQSDGKIITGGNFATYNNTIVNGIARLYTCNNTMPGRITGVNTVTCGGSAVYAVNPVAGATKYVWNLPAGWTGASDSASVYVTFPGVGGVVSVADYNDHCGTSMAQTDTIVKIAAPDVPICLVTVDSLSTHNIITWRKPHTTLIDSFCIYRETISNVYAKIGTVPFDSLALFHDYDANPNTTSYRYKLSVIDTCGAESSLSLYQNTIHLQNLGEGNLQWTFYQIENTPNPVISFNIYKDPYGDGNFVPIGLVPGTNSTFTDINYAGFPNGIYVVDVNWAVNCGDIHAVNTTRSNIRHIASIDTLGAGVNPVSENDFDLYPNPARNTFYISCNDGLVISRVQIFNQLGQCMGITGGLTPKMLRKTLAEVNVAGLATGVYFLSIETPTGRIIKKLVVN